MRRRPWRELCDDELCWFTDEELETIEFELCWLIELELTDEELCWFTEPDELEVVEEETPFSE